MGHLWRVFLVRCVVSVLLILSVCNLPAPSKGCFLVGFKYLKAFKKHPFEGLGMCLGLRSQFCDPHRWRIIQMTSEEGLLMAFGRRNPKQIEKSKHEMAMGQNLFGTFSVGMTSCLKGFLRVTGVWGFDLHPNCKG